MGVNTDYFLMQLPVDWCGEGAPSPTDDDTDPAVTPGEKKPELSGDDTNRTDCNKEKLVNNVDAGENMALSNNIDNNKQQNNNHGMYRNYRR